MPKSKHRKNRKPFKGKASFRQNYAADPLDVFHKIGSGLLGKTEEDAACQMLLRASDNRFGTPAMQTVIAAAGLSGPPATTEDIRKIAKVLVGR